MADTVNVHRWRAISSTAASASQCSCQMVVMPYITGIRAPTMRAVVCPIGEAMNTTSSAPSRYVSATCRVPRPIVLCVCITPFGLASVPDVNMSVAT